MTWRALSVSPCLQMPLRRHWLLRPIAAHSTNQHVSESEFTSGAEGETGDEANAWRDSGAAGGVFRGTGRTSLAGMGAEAMAGCMVAEAGQGAGAGCSEEGTRAFSRDGSKVEGGSRNIPPS